MLDQLTDADFGSLQPDPRHLYRSQVIGKSVPTMANFAGPGGIVDLNVSIDHMITLAVRRIPAAKAKCFGREARRFIFHYVRHFMHDDLFVARARVSMLQHVLSTSGVSAEEQAIIEHALATDSRIGLGEKVAAICNTSDHLAMRLQLIRAFTNEAILRVLSDHMVIEEP